ncbi:uncharacterized protein FIBRA_08808 [Fibroporia radiculosa]|uniref:Uncharacterized protein n=1 Tax=Fibroporia radiculosa TaxID=599839 RepID=J4GXG1_9APHY|nr:uncharacterized protein FIBRA_08808 [Fibroporia radiculosa]CCM06535.1 predicted protein [Fibroporia radiculosa]
MNLIDLPDVVLKMHVYNRRPQMDALVASLMASFASKGVLGLHPENALTIAIPRAAFHGPVFKTPPPITHKTPYLKLKPEYFKNHVKPLEVPLVAGQHRYVALTRYVAADQKLLASKKAVLDEIPLGDSRAAKLQTDIAALEETLQKNAVWAVRVYDRVGLDNFTPMRTLMPIGVIANAHTYILDKDACTIGRYLGRNEHTPKAAETADERLEAHLLDLKEKSGDEYKQLVKDILQEHRQRSGVRSGHSNALSKIVGTPELLKVLVALIPGRRHFLASGLLRVKAIEGMDDVYLGLICEYLAHHWQLLGIIGSTDPLNANVADLEAARDDDIISAPSGVSAGAIALKALRELRGRLWTDATPDWEIWTDDILDELNAVVADTIKHPEDMGMNIPRAIVELKKYRQAVLAVITKHFAKDIECGSAKGTHAINVRERMRLYLMPPSVRDSNDVVPMPLLTSKVFADVVREFAHYKQGLLELARMFDPLIDYRHHLQDASNRDAWIIVLRGLKINYDWLNDEAPAAVILEAVWGARTDFVAFLEWFANQTPPVYSEQRSLKRAQIAKWQPLAEGEAAPTDEWKTRRNTLYSVDQLQDLDALVHARDLAKDNSQVMVARAAGDYSGAPRIIAAHPQLRLLFLTGVPWWPGCKKDPRHKLWPFVLGAYWERAYNAEVRPRCFNKCVVEWRNNISKDLGLMLMSAPTRPHSGNFQFPFPDGLAHPAEPLENPEWLAGGNHTVSETKEKVAVALLRQEQANDRHAAIQKIVSMIERLPFVQSAGQATDAIDRGVSNAVEHLLEVLDYAAARATYRDTQGDPAASFDPSMAGSAFRQDYRRRASVVDVATLWPEDITTFWRQSQVEAPSGSAVIAEEAPGDDAGNVTGDPTEPSANLPAKRDRSSSGGERRPGKKARSEDTGMDVDSSPSDAPPVAEA